MKKTTFLPSSANVAAEAETMDVCCGCGYMIYERTTSAWRCTSCKEPYCNNCANYKKACLVHYTVPPEPRPNGTMPNKFF